MIDAVVKVGGSLGRGERLREVCASLAEAGRRHRLLVVPGGGAAADVVREQDARFGLRPSTAHWMAVLAMDQFGLLLTDLTPGAEAVSSLDRARTRLAEEGGVVVLLPSEPLRRADALPHSWSVTSDAIAAWIAQETDGRLLVLLKDHHGMARLGPAGPSGTARLMGVA
ncbi:MAG: aspartate/glutamate/uridylate kinase, partial [Deltaproteobacteria bacterium]